MTNKISLQEFLGFAKKMDSNFLLLAFVVVGVIVSIVLSSLAYANGKVSSDKTALQSNPSAGVTAFDGDVQATTFSMLEASPSFSTSTQSPSFSTPLAGIGLLYTDTNKALHFFTSLGDSVVSTSPSTGFLPIVGGTMQGAIEMNGFALSGVAKIATIATLESTAIGFEVLLVNTGTQNTAVGHQTLKASTSGIGNSAFGANALTANTTGAENASFGLNALKANITGTQSCAFGSNALANSTIVDGNCAFGASALETSIDNVQCCAFGTFTLASNDGDACSAFGFHAMFDSKTANDCAAFGSFAMRDTNGSRNCAFGHQAMLVHTSGTNNACLGYRSLFNSTSGSDNTAVGNNAGAIVGTGSQNTFVGSSSTALDQDVKNCTALGYAAQANESNKVRIGNGSVLVIEGEVDFTMSSDARIKTNVTHDIPGLEFITRLEPVSYNKNMSLREAITGPTPDFPGKYDVDSVSYTGFVAQQVQAIADEIGFTSFSGVKKGSETVIWGLTISDLIPSLVKSVQELNAKLQTM